MTVTLCLLRHGRASGQGPDAGLLPEGEAAVRRLGRRLARERLVLAAAYSSPLRRARETASIVLAELACDAPLAHVDELAPDADPARALAVLRALGPAAGRVLVVTHLPLVARLAGRLLERDLDFPPGAFAEIELAGNGGAATLRRTIGPGEPDAA